MKNMKLELRKDCSMHRFQTHLCRDSDHCEGRCCWQGGHVYREKEEYWRPHLQVETRAKKIEGHRGKQKSWVYYHGRQEMRVSGKMEMSKSEWAQEERVQGQVTGEQPEVSRSPSSFCDMVGTESRLQEAKWVGSRATEVISKDYSFCYMSRKLCLLSQSMWKDKVIFPFL